MATFYLLPPRDELARQFSGYLQSWFPGVSLPHDELPNLLAEIAESNDGVVVLFGDDLSEERGDDLDEALCEAFGAVSRDRVIDLRAGSIGSTSRIETWMVRRGRSSRLRKV